MQRRIEVEVNVGIQVPTQRVTQSSIRPDVHRDMLRGTRGIYSRFSLDDRQTADCESLMGAGNVRHSEWCGESHVCADRGASQRSGDTRAVKRFMLGVIVDQSLGSHLGVRCAGGQRMVCQRRKTSRMVFRTLSQTAAMSCSALSGSKSGRPSPGLYRMIEPGNGTAASPGWARKAISFL